MSTAITRMPRSEAVEIANRFVDLLAGTHSQLLIAGSIRRRIPTVGDIEIVATPVLEAVPTLDMFGEQTSMSTVDHLDARLTMLLDRGTVEKRLDSNGRGAWGLKHKRILFEGAPVDLFTPDADRWGLIVAIRTGPSDFSNALVTPSDRRTRTGRVGLLPPIYRVQDGWLTFRTSGERIKTPHERRLFEILNLGWIDPWARV